ncbi:MAG: hypothetical protein M1826_003556 [Phylliscum demangeonii]|nr:MAG: hypothetical protein M1826_003556 [Phylliscum demangeonii]
MWTSFEAMTKLRYESPPPELVRMRTLKLNTDGEPADLQIGDLVSTAMSKVPGLTSFSTDLPSSRISSGAAAMMVNRTGAGVGAGADERPSPSSRKSSSAFSVNGRGARSPESESSNALSPLAWSSEGSTTTDGLSSSATPWSSAVGRATTGKSGRVIERIQTENDRLRRELKLETLHREEEQKKSETAWAQMQSLQTANDNLVQMRELDGVSLARRERKLDEAKAELAGERSRRVVAEAQLKELMRESEKTEEGLRAHVREESERAGRATTQYDVLAASWRQMDDDYRRRTDRLKEDLLQLHARRADDRRKLDRLEVTMEQHKQEVEKMRLANERMALEFAAYRLDSDESTRLMKHRAECNDQAADEAVGDALQLLGQMRHVINVRKYVRGGE